MFKCDVCGCSGKGQGIIGKENKYKDNTMVSGTKMKKIVTEYKYEKYEKVDGTPGLRPQIKKELSVCPICAEKMKDYEAKIVD